MSKPAYPPDYRLDMVGEPCSQSISNIPLNARNHGYEVLEIQQVGPTIRYLIRRRFAGQGTAWRGMMTSGGERSLRLLGCEPRALDNETFNPRRSVRAAQANDSAK